MNKQTIRIKLLIEKSRDGNIEDLTIKLDKFIKLLRDISNNPI